MHMYRHHQGADLLESTLTGAGAVSYTHLDVYKRQVPANTIQAINSLQTHSREMDISLSDGVPKRMAAILFMEMVQ